MSMLAEPRRYRNRYNLVPRGKALYEDEERFGTKLLKKMGWSKGKGLGAKEQGDQEFVRVRYKNDERGLGFEERDDHWTQHAESFNGLLKTLNGESDGSEKASGNVSDEEVPRIGFGFAPEPKEKKAKLKDKFSGESLEEKSKRSKARVHYKKFTRGKDLSQYSEKDLANIFGKKVTEELEANNEAQNMMVATKEYINDLKEDKMEMNSGFTISTGLSVNDYFKQKMEAMKIKLKGDGQVKEDSENLITECAKAPKIKKRKRSIMEESENLIENHVEAPKSKKSKHSVKEVTDDNNECPIVEQKKIKQKKSKMMKNEDVIVLSEESNDLTTNDCQQLLTIDKTLKDKKKKSKVKLDNVKEDLLIESQEDQVIVNAETKKKKKNKSKNKKIIEISSEEAESSEVLQENNSTESVKTKKKKKNKNVDVDVDAEVETIVDSKECSTKKSKKKSSSANVETSSAKNDKNVSVNNNNKLDQAVDVDNNNSNTAVRSATKPTELLSLDELIAKRDSYNIYTISSFCAEKFRHTAIENYNGSNMAHINGYSYEQDFKLDIQRTNNDQDNITQLWNCTLDKYRDAVPKYNFYKYVKDVRNARKTKAKLPRLNMKSWKRKHVFQGI